MRARARRVAGPPAIACLLAIGAVVAGGSARAQDSTLVAASASGDLADLSLEQLSNVRVTSVSRRSERLSDAAGSIYVITAEDIRRSGAKTLPEALRLAPTLEVARADANQYAITARGMNSVLANKMLVLIDGRTIYSPLFSGTFWEEPDLVLQDVDRIEVISGPGGTSWGSNAVNGVINIITRPVTQSKGWIVAGGGGDALRVGEGRLGWGSAPFMRVSGKYVHQDHTEFENEVSARDGSERFQAAARGRWEAGSNAFGFEGGGYSHRIDQVTDDRKVSGFHVLGGWVREPAVGPGFRLRGYFQRARRDQPGTILDVLDTYDMEFQNEWNTSRQTFVWGAGYRFQQDRADNVGPGVALLPPERDLEYANLFAEDVFHVRERVDVTAGLRFERNVYTGWEYLPTVRLALHPAASHVLWLALSRAVRAPARVDREVFSPAQPPYLVLAGGPDFRSEILRSAEIGYRAQPVAAVSYSVAGYVHDYDRLRSLAPSPAGPVFENGIHGTVMGIESWLHYRVLSAWRVSGGVTGLRHDYHLDAGSVDLGQRAALDVDPDSWWSLRNAFDLGTEGELDVLVRHVGDLPLTKVPGYTTVDGRIGWRFFRSVELSVAGRNLLGPRHAEWGPAPNRVSFGPSVFAQLEWRL